MTPLGDRILVLPSLGEEKKGLIVIPETARSKPQEGTVVAIGAVVKEIAVGDKILFGKYVASEIQLDGVLHLIVREPDVMVRL